MIGIKIGEQEYDLPTSWTELKFKQWYGLQKEVLNWGQIISIATGISEEVISALKAESVEKLISFLSWIKNENDLMKTELPQHLEYEGKKYLCPKDIKEQTWGQKVALHQKIISSDTKNSITFAVAIYLLPVIQKKKFNPDELEAAETLATYLEEENAYNIVAIGNNYIEQTRKVAEVENSQLAKGTSREHILAGVKMFEKFGVFNTIDALAGGDILKYKKVQQIEYNQVFLKLLMNHHSGIFQENLNKVLHNRRK